jgi:nucleoid DNA-binding protein
LSKSAIIAQLREQGLTTAQANDEIDRVFTAVAAAVNQDQTVRIPGFGTFRRKFRDSSKRRNPRTGESIITAPRHVITFKEAKAKS